MGQGDLCKLTTWKKNIIRLHDKAFEISPRKLKMWEN